MDLDTSFDFRSDSPQGDPDKYSPTLRRYHQLLWSKALPSGAPFVLEDGGRGNYLVHRSDLGTFWLSSDAVIATFRKKARPIVEELGAAALEEFQAVGYTMGGMMLFPSNRVDGKMTLNGARGFHPQVADRLDLTVECIRRHYRGEASPLSEALARHADFFSLFDDFAGYVDHFLLKDLLTPEGDQVAFFMSFDDFRTPAVPRDVETYREYRQRSIDFVRARNRRIDDYWAERTSAGTGA
jgi:hypothetical protein